MYISSSKIVQGERNKVYFNAEPQPIFCKNKENMKITPTYNLITRRKVRKKSEIAPTYNLITWRNLGEK